MRIAKNYCAQGDVMFRRVSALPADVKPAPAPADGTVVVAHSETGHHHAIHHGEAVLFERLERDPMVCYLQVASFADVVHHRPFDTHETWRLDAGVWEVRRQREYTPEGWRRVCD